MSVRFRNLILGLGAVLLLASTVDSGAFALLGPVQPWMQPTNGVVYAPDIGGPMEVTNEYRWNVPLVTYGFDQSFLDYFGSNGVAAVQSAIQILNDLPPASQLTISNYPFIVRGLNYTAQSQGLTDLKSETLWLLLEHLGLAAPTRFAYVLRSWDSTYVTAASPWHDIEIAIVGMPVYQEQDPYGCDTGSSGGSPGYVTNFVAGFCFDPRTLTPTCTVNNILYFGYIQNDGLGQRFVQTVAADPSEPQVSAAADGPLQYGEFYDGLTYDDVGGLSYLLSTNNVNFEPLIPGVAGAGTNANNFVNGAWRPGVDKITFVQQSLDVQTGTFIPVTNYFTDCYLTNGVLKQQQLVRITSQPDFLFSAVDPASEGLSTPWVTRTSTTNWLNEAAANGNPNGAGPGVIPPPVRIEFGGSGPVFGTDGRSSDTDIGNWSTQLGSYDGSTNTPVVFPIPRTDPHQITVTMRLTLPGKAVESFLWQPSSTAARQFAMQTSTNLSNWFTLFTLPNTVSATTYWNYYPASVRRFYRLIPQ